VQPITEQAKFDPHELTAERVGHFYRRRHAAWLTHAISGGFMALVLWPGFGAWALLWWAGFLLAHGLQWHMGRSRASDGRAVMPMSSLYPHRAAAWLAGMAWGAAGATLPWLGAREVPMVLVLVVVAVVVSLPRMAAMPELFLAFACGALLPMAGVAFALPSDQARMVWTVVALVSMALWVSARAVEADLMEVVVSRLSLERMAWEDKLTGLANRRRFDALLQDEWRRAARLGVPLTLLLMDVDHFKRFNDTYGHTAGDACLAMVGGVLRSAVRRAGDVAARYGGEEFVVLLFHTNRADGVQMGERIRQAVRSLGVAQSGVPHEVVTLSIGGATVVPRAEASPLTLLNQADLALYDAKSAGRDKVVWSNVM
jgi:diguanylate cyclase (GGDEF)-like protein